MKNNENISFVNFYKYINKLSTQKNNNKKKNDTIHYCNNSKFNFSLKNKFQNTNFIAKREKLKYKTSQNSPNASLKKIDLNNINDNNLIIKDLSEYNYINNRNMNKFNNKNKEILNDFFIKKIKQVYTNKKMINDYKIKKFKQKSKSSNKLTTTQQLNYQNIDGISKNNNIFFDNKTKLIKKNIFNASQFNRNNNLNLTNYLNKTKDYNFNSYLNNNHLEENNISNNVNDDINAFFSVKNGNNHSGIVFMNNKKYNSIENENNIINNKFISMKYPYNNKNILNDNINSKYKNSNISNTNKILIKYIENKYNNLIGSKTLLNKMKPDKFIFNNNENDIRNLSGKNKEIKYHIKNNTNNNHSKSINKINSKILNIKNQYQILKDNHKKYSTTINSKNNSKNKSPNKLKIRIKFNENSDNKNNLLSNLNDNIKLLNKNINYLSGKNSNKNILLNYIKEKDNSKYRKNDLYDSSHSISYKSFIYNYKKRNDSFFGDNYKNKSITNIYNIDINNNNQNLNNNYIFYNKENNDNNNNINNEQNNPNINNQQNKNGNIKIIKNINHSSSLNNVNYMKTYNINKMIHIITPHNKDYIKQSNSPSLIKVNKIINKKEENGGEENIKNNDNPIKNNLNNININQNKINDNNIIKEINEGIKNEKLEIQVENGNNIFIEKKGENKQEKIVNKNVLYDEQIKIPNIVSLKISGIKEVNKINKEEKINKNEEDNSKNIKEKKNNENIELKSENYNLNNNMDKNINEFLNKEEKNQNTDNNNINDLILDNKNDKKAELNNLEVNLEDNKSKENINENEEKNISFEDKKIIDLEKNNSNIEDIEDNKNNNENNDYISNNNVSNIENINNEEGNDNNNIYNKESNNIENITTQINQQKSDNYSKHIITTDFEELKKDKKEEEKKSESESKNSNQGDSNNNKEFSNNNNYEEYPDILCNIKENKESNENEQSILTIQSRDCLYYQNELEKLSSYIKKYYSENNSYPQSGIQFYLFGREIGHGAFGKVNLCLHIASGHLVAMKTFVKKDLKYKETKEKLKNEVEVLSKLHHPFINQILDSFETETHFFIVMEYICGDLLSFIRKRNKLNEASAKIIFKQIIEGLKYIHKKKIVHRDIKLDNILIDLTNTIKICDFGVSRKFEKGNIIYERCGTPAYIAPEIYAKIGYDGPQCDIWSAGVTLYYILSGNLPFRGSNIQELEKLIINGDYEEIKNVSEEANDIVAGMLRVDPKKRLTIDEILKHPWLKNIKLENRYNLNIFTEAEKNLLSKYDVDYLNSSKSDLIENFTYRNLLLDNSKKKISGNTKSIIYAPYNSCVNEDSKEEENINIISYLNKEEKALYDELEINNNICKFGWRVKQANLNYELSNNDDFDNGLMKSVKEEEYKNKNEKIENKDINHIKNKTLESVKDYEKIKIDKKILEHIEKNVGYDKKYLTKCLKKNIINYSTATYYLLYRDKLNDNNNY